MLAFKPNIYFKTLPNLLYFAFGYIDQIINEIRIYILMRIFIYFLPLDDLKNNYFQYS